jgi:hypothetical protein
MDDETPVLAPPRMRFGPQDTQELPFDWAEKGMCWLYKERRAVFADMMLHVMDTGLVAKRTRANGQR